MTIRGLYGKILSRMWENFIARFDLTQLLTNLFIAVSTGFLVGKLGVRRGLEQARKERAFDRSLQWHESTLRATSKFIFLSNQFRAVLEASNLKSIFDPVERVPIIAADLRSCASELREAIFDAVLFADKKTVNQLRSAAEAIEHVSSHADQVAKGSTDELVLFLKLKPLDELVMDIHLSLVHAIRKQLGLEQLTASDVGFSPEPKGSGVVRRLVLPRLPGLAKLFPWLFPQSRELKNNGMNDEITKA